MCARERIDDLECGWSGGGDGDYIGGLTSVLVLAFDAVVQHEDFVDVKDDSGEVTDDEHEDDAKEDGRQVHLGGALRVPPPGTLVSHLNACHKY